MGEKEHTEKIQQGYSNGKVNYPAPSKEEVLKKGYVPRPQSQNQSTPPRPPLKK